MAVGTGPGPAAGGAAGTWVRSLNVTAGAHLGGGGRGGVREAGPVPGDPRVPEGSGVLALGEEGMCEGSEQRTKRPGLFRTAAPAPCGGRWTLTGRTCQREGAAAGLGALWKAGRAPLPVARREREGGAEEAARAGVKGQRTPLPVWAGHGRRRHH